MKLKEQTECRARPGDAGAVSASDDIKVVLDFMS
jgi:hypothetical protein